MADFRTADTEARLTAGFFSLTRLRDPATWRGMLSAALDLVFPPRCAHCGQVDTRFCETCLAALQDYPLRLQITRQDPLVALVSTGLHRGVLQSAVQAIKYYHTRRLAPVLAVRLQMALSGAVCQSWTFDSVLPVPMHTRRLQERGYNQAEDISHALARQRGCSHLPQALRRVQATRSQVGLTRAERLANVAGAFAGDPALLTGQTLLLVDDVRTTGATIAACAQAALDAGASRVYGLTVSAAD
jgi:ComF family protein